MRINFRKISAIASGILMLGMTAGIAAASNYPQPFVVGSSPNVAVVYGASSLDYGASTTITTSLNTFAPGIGSTGLGSESVKFERSSDLFNLGDSATEVVATSITKSSPGTGLPTLLADGTYLDADNNEFTYTQKIDLGNNINLTHFRDTDLSTTPSLGIKIPSGAHVLNYTLDFTKDPTFTTESMVNTNLPFLGKTYFILSVDNSTAGAFSMTLLDSASTETVTNGGTVTVTAGGNTYTVTPAIFGSTTVKLTINGQTTPSLAKGDTYKLSDGSYVGIKDLIVQNYQGGQQLAEFSIGKGKLVLTDNDEVQLNDESVSGLTSYLTNDSSTTRKLTKIVLSWATDDKQFITPTSDLILPGFGNIKLSMTGMNFPKQEETTVEPDGTTSIQLVAPIKSGTASLNLLYSDATGAITGLGRDSDNLLVTSNTTKLNFNQTANDKWFVASWNNTQDSESYLLSASITTSDNANRTAIKDEVTGTTLCSDLTAGDTCSIGDFYLTVEGVNKSTDYKAVNLSISSGGSFNTLYTAEGLKFFLPWLNNGTGAGDVYFGAGGLYGHNATSWYLFANGTDKDHNLGKGGAFNMTVTSNTNDELELQTVYVAGDGTSGLRIGDTDSYEFYTLSDVTSKIVQDRSSGSQRSAVITYSGTEASAGVYLTSTDTSGGTTTGGLGNVLVTDSQVSTVASKNLIVVGGSCINSAAASLVGGAYCGSAWTTATGIGAGQFLIKKYSSGIAGNSFALLVAGYEAADTQNAATFLTTKTVDTSVGGKGTTSTAPLTSFA